jgi:hypothetical protein
MYWASRNCIGVTLLRAELLRQLPDSCTPLVFFDPQYRVVLELDKQPGSQHQKGNRERPAHAYYRTASCDQRQAVGDRRQDAQARLN